MIGRKKHDLKKHVSTFSISAGNLQGRMRKIADMKLVKICQIKKVTTLTLIVMPKSA